jgi:hypothetical protein
VSVEVEQLDQFNRQITDLAQGFLDLAIAGVITPLGDTPVNFAGGGLVEGRGFFGPYQNCVEGLGEFLGQAVQGLTSLATVSMMAGVQYVIGDTESADLLATVTNAFEPPPLPTDPAVWERLIAWDEGRRQDAAARENEFEDMVARYQNGEPPSGDPGGAFRLPYSDFYTNDAPLRGDGQFWERPAAWTDVQDVNRVDLPDPGDSLLDDVDLRQPLPPEEYQDQVTAATEEWAGYDGDVPGTEYDDPPDD